MNANTEAHMKTLGLRHMPSNMRDITSQKFVVAPNRDAYVFVRVKGDAPAILISDGANE